MKNQSSNAKIEGIIKKAITRMVDTELYVWPPACAAFLYQPMRPKKLDENKSNTEGNMQQ